MDSMICRHQNLCSGCSFLETPVSEQRAKKLTALRERSGVTPEFVDGPSLHFRDRTDFRLHEGKLGFYNKDKKIFDLQKCEVFSPELQTFFLEFSKNLPAIRKGSIRLRAGMNNERGVWLDFAN